MLVCVKPSTCCVLLRDSMLMGVFCSCTATYIIDLLACAYSRLSTGLSYLGSTSKKVLLLSVFFNFYHFSWLHVLLLGVQPGVQDDRHRRRILIMNSYSVYSWGRQLLKHFCHYSLRKFFCLDSVLVKSRIPCFNPILCCMYYMIQSLFGYMKFY